MANTTWKTIAVDSRGRTSLAKVRRQVHDRYTVTEHPDGTIVLVPVISLSPAEVAKLRGGGGLIMCWHCGMALLLEDRAAAEPDEAEAEALLLMAREQYERCDCEEG